MSNCVHLRHNEVCFKKSQFVPAFLPLVENATQPGENDKTQEYYDNYVAWWFLQANTFIENNLVYVVFGDGNSGHTWRDLRQTVELINRYLVPGVLFYHTFLAEDEGFPGWGKLRVKFETGAECEFYE